ncbi:hypothetical protein NDU88_000047 [Pleurodeles waltl]|uniref:Uncharacterized protein n=1 Tax=Pleurodeles waltl TaxID=8319 RepID=A0AAV7UR27_PLEWA|nr:hypothetical protein NDU88_000047 [Pleurodeles waltl]
MDWVANSGTLGCRAPPDPYPAIKFQGSCRSQACGASQSPEEGGLNPETVWEPCVHRLRCVTASSQNGGRAYAVSRSRKSAAPDGSKSGPGREPITARLKVC